MATSFKKPIQDCYEILGIATNASTKDINSAYKKLALKHHPDKAGGNDASNDEFQKINEAVEILRDPVRRIKHDQELSRIKRVFVEEHVEFDPSYTGWRPHNPMWFGLQTDRERYMYSYGNSVHMNPNSRESQEEKARVENERKYGEEMRKRREEEIREEKQRVEDEVLREARRRMAMRARVIRDEELMAECATLGEDYHDGYYWGEDGQPAYSTYYGYGESRYEGEQAQFDPGEEYAEHHYYPDYPGYEEEGLAEDENGEEDLLSFEEDEQQSEGGEQEDDKGGEEEDFYEEQDTEDNEASSSQSTHRTATEYNPRDSERDEPSPLNSAANESKLSVSQYETTHEEQSEDDAPYFSFSEDVQSAKSESSSSHRQESTGAGDNYIKVDADLYSHIAPFLPLFEAKLNHPSGCYTRADMHSELRGIVMEIFSGWLESLRLGFSEAHTSEVCEHLGYWTKEYGCNECQVCHRWKPIFTLTCPGCGLKACVVCKFRV